MRFKIKSKTAITTTRSKHIRLLAIMGFIHLRNLVSVWVVFCCLCLDVGTTIDTITSSELIKDPETLSSNSGTFTLGIFSPENSTNRYVGIWYLSESIIIWVANRNQPLSLNSSGIVTISVDGNLVVSNNEKAVWSSNVTHIASNSTAKLLETGNLVLLDGTTGEVTWERESFKHPSDVYVPNMRVSNNRITGEKVVFTSWKSPSDPSVGYYSVTLDAPEFFYWVNGTHPYYRTGPWNGRVFIGFPHMSSEYLKGWSVGNEDDGTVYLSFEYANKSDFAISALTPQGTLKLVGWNNKQEIGSGALPLLETYCDVYGVCGAFGSCNSQTSPICSCLSGYEPKNLEEWNRKNWTSGCVRKLPLQCGGEVSRDGFLKLENAKVPDYAERSASLEDECRAQCLKNCSCVAYAYDSGIGCMLWSGHLMDIQRFSSGGVDLFIRVAPSELDAGKQHSDKTRDKRLIIAVGVTIGIITLAGCAYLSWKWNATAGSRRIEMFSRFIRGEAPTISKTDKKIGELSEVELQELLLFDVEDIIVATNNFDSSNKLGQGGFGPVYKGKLKDGQEIAVKRLSRASR